MAIRGDSYSSSAEVLAFTRHYLDGQTAFNSTTQPTVTEVEKYIDRASGVLNVALSKEGLTTPISNSTAKLQCDDWVTSRAVEYVELGHRGSGFGGEEGQRYLGFRNMQKAAGEFAGMNSLGFKRLGVGVSDPVRQGLTFTGLSKRSARTDPSDTSLAQPHFRRDQFGDPAINST